jgi:hypothetical protein
MPENSGMAAAHEHAVGAELEGPDDERGVDPAGTHHPHGSDVLGVFEPGRAGEVGARICTPVAGDAQYFGFKVHSGFPPSKFH